MQKSLGIYIHIPFCEKKCPYCSFYSVKCSEEMQQKYTEKVCAELQKWGKNLKRRVSTVYFGGGTPSLIGAEKIIKILNAVNENFEVSNPEITLEVNPADYSSVDFKKLAFSGVNRVSVGAQALDDESLKVLGRRHSVNDIIKTYESIKLAKIDNISFDMIIGFPGQRLDNIKTFLNFYKENRLSHLSAYLLKVEPGTPYFESNLEFISDDICSDFYIFISDEMKKMGYEHYEISNFSLPGKRSRHNMKYWNLEDYLGIGPSAHSLIDGERFYYENNINNFILNPKILSESIGGTPEEYAMLRFRLSDGLINEEYQKKFGTSIPEEYFRKAEKFEDFGLVKINENNIALTSKGFLLSNKIISDLIL